MNSGIYSLIARNIDTNEAITIKINDEYGETKTKINISSIDKFTVSSLNKKELIKKLNDRGDIDFFNADLFVMYKYDNELHYIDLLYKRFEQMPDLLEINEEVKINVNHPLFKKSFDNFIKAINNKEARQYFLNDSSIKNDKLKEKIREYFENKPVVGTNDNYQSFYKHLFIEYLKIYRTFRNLTLSAEDFKFPDLKRERSEKNKQRRIMILDKKIELLNKEPINNQSELPIKKEETFKNLLNIKVPSDFYLGNKSTSYNSKTIDDAKTWKNEKEELIEKIDLDDLAYLTNDELDELGIDNDFTKQIRK